MTSSWSRRTLFGVGGAAALGTALSLPRLTGQDIPGRGDDVLTIAILGTNADAASRAGLVEAFAEVHPDIPVQFRAVQGSDWGDFFAKLLTMVAAGEPPDLCLVATEGAQLFADRLAEPLDPYITRDADELAEYFTDVHPSLVESFMYDGSLFSLPLDFNAANMYVNRSAIERAGLEMPGPDWTLDDFTRGLQAVQDSENPGVTPYFWTNRLFGGVVPWLYVNDTNVLSHEPYPGGDWLWSRFYPGEEARGGGIHWTGAQAEHPQVIEVLEFLQSLAADGLASAPAQGGGAATEQRFGAGGIGFTPAGGYWAQGLHESGMGPDEFDVTFFPRWRTQQHQFGAAGYAVMAASPRKDAAWEWVKFSASREAMQIAYPEPVTTPARRSMLTEAFYQDTGPRHWQRFYDTLDEFPTTMPIPAPPQQAAVESALIKNVLTAVGGSAAGVESAAGQLQRDLARALGGTP